MYDTLLKKEFDHRHNIINLLKSFVNHWSQFNSSQSQTMPQQSEQFKRLVKESFLVIVVSTQNYEVYLKEPYLFAKLYWSNMKGGTTLTRYYVGFTRFCIAPLTLLSFDYIIILISLIYFFFKPLSLPYQHTQQQWYHNLTLILQSTIKNLLFMT